MVAGRRNRAGGRPARPDRANVALGTTGDHRDELKVAKVRRISHPGYGAGQCTFGIRDPWNYDRSRLMYNEGANFTGKPPYYYEGEPIPDHSRDGRQLIFPSYDGVYSPDDHEAFGSAPWGYCGLFLADLVPAAGNDDRVAPSKPAMLNGVVDPSSRSIRLTWARCTDNVGVDAYNVYRDGQKIATTGLIDYIDTIQGPVSASYRYSIGAVDVAGNEAKSSEITVSAALGLNVGRPSELSVRAAGPQPKRAAPRSRIDAKLKHAVSIADVGGDCAHGFQPLPCEKSPSPSSDSEC